ncbi:MAG: DUF1844 domain-containing protein [Bacteroidota bacterium]
MEQQKAQLLFTQLVGMFHAAGMQQMGKLKNPLTGNIERDLSQAQVSIDMLDVVKEKTKGNLHPEEERFLDSILSELKLNFVDELNKNQAAKTQDQVKSPPEGQ